LAALKRLLGAPLLFVAMPVAISAVLELAHLLEGRKPERASDPGAAVAARVKWVSGRAQSCQRVHNGDGVAVKPVGRHNLNHHRVVLDSGRNAADHPGTPAT
jgi:hypothetical protein